MAESEPDVPTSPGTLALSELERTQEAAGATATLEALKATVAKVRRPDGKIRRAKLLASVLALRFEGKTPNESARILGVAKQQVHAVLLQLRTDHQIDALLQRLDDHLLPLAVDNATAGILRGDKDYTLELLRGRGLLRTHKSIEAHVKQTTLNLTVTMSAPPRVDGQPLPIAREGTIVGAPLAPKGLEASAPVIEGEIVSRGRDGRAVTVVPDTL